MDRKDLEGKSVIKLKEIAKKLSVKGRSKMKKVDLIEILSSTDSKISEETPLAEGKISDTIRRKFSTIVHPSKVELFYKRIIVRYLLKAASKLNIDVIKNEHKTSLFYKIFIVGDTKLDVFFNSLNVEYLREIKMKLKIKSETLKSKLISAIIEYFTTEGEPEENCVRKNIPQSLRLAIWKTHCGDDIEHKCLCCGTSVMHHIDGSHDWVCGHVLAVSKGGETVLSNLRPICPSCNSSMGDMCMDEFKKLFS